jgi:hypothetical protein
MWLTLKNVSHFVLVGGMMYLFKSIYIQKLTTLLLSQAVAQSDEKKKYRWRSVVGYLSPTIAFSSFLMVFAVSPLHVDAFAKK